MSSNRVGFMIFALIGGGVGVLVARYAGVASWLDAKLYITAGVVGGVAICLLIEKLFN